MKRLVQIGYLLAIWLLFCLGAILCFFAPLAAILLAVFRPSLKPVRIEEIVLSQDRLNAALLGFGGLHTVSAECAARECKFCHALCKILSWADPGHCHKSAIKEGLIK